MTDIMNMSLAGKRALVTGSTRGIGLAAAKGLASMGAEVIVNGRADADCQDAIAKVRDAVPGAAVESVAADLANRAGCDAVIAAFPAVDILVNNMGIYGPKPFFDTPDEDWQQMFDTNIMSGVRLTRHYLKGMLDQNAWGRVVFVSSESAIFVPKEMVHYGFSKSAQLVVARGAAELTKGTDVTVNSVLPGPTAVEAQAERYAARAADEGTTVEALNAAMFTERRPASLLQRFASTEEVASMICYVCSKASSASNGAVFRVDGGIVTNPF